MHRYYIKKLGSQEMGSPKMFPDGSTKYARGRYIYISKDHDDFFPHLSELVLNDKAFIKLSMPFSAECIYATFGYHNSKHIDGALGHEYGMGRNEMRIYLNNQLDNEKQYFHPGEIVVFDKVEDDGGYIYMVSVYATHQPEYARLEHYIDARKGFGLVDERLPFINRRQVSQTTAEISGNVATAIIEGQAGVLSDNQRDDEIALGAGLFNSNTFHDFVMQAYGYKCAITNQAIFCNNLLNLEAAHIKPRAHNGLYLPCNGIAMSRDMHFAFDKGFFTIDENYKIVIHPDVLRTDSYINMYNGHELHLPQVDYFKPNQNYLQYHRDTIYGTFRQIRRLSDLVSGYQ